MAGTAGLAFGHICHGHPLTATVGEGLGVAVRALIRSSVEVMAEIANYRAAAVFEGQVGRLVANVALVTVTG